MLLPFLALFLLPLSLLVAAGTVEDNHVRLVELAAANNGVIRLDENIYDMLTHPKRTWSATVHFTALDKRRKCSPCREFDPNFNAVAKSWTKVPQQDRDQHFFATADFDSASAVFQKLGMQSAPVVHVYPAAEGARRPANGKTAPISYEFAHGFDAQPLAEQLSSFTPVRIPFAAPIDYSRMATFGGLTLLAIVSVRFLAPILRNRWFWAAVTVITSLVMTSGYMFTRIRGMPHSGANGQWVAPGYQNQFGQEVQVISMIYASLAGAVLMLTLVVPRQTSPQRQRAQVYLWTSVIFIMFSVLVSLFRIKNRGYPFKLLLS